MSEMNIPSKFVRTFATVDVRNTSSCMNETQNCSIGMIVQLLANGRHLVMFMTITATKRAAVRIIDPLRIHRICFLRCSNRVKY